MHQLSFCNENYAELNDLVRNFKKTNLCNDVQKYFPIIFIHEHAFLFRPKKGTPQKHPT